MSVIMYGEQQTIGIMHGACSPETLLGTGVLRVAYCKRPKGANRG